MKVCSCDDKGEGRILNGIFEIYYIRGGIHYIKPFKYCPWCGKELQDEKQEDIDNMNKVNLGIIPDAKNKEG